MVGKLHRVMASFHTTNHHQRGYAPFDRNPAHFRGWQSLFRSLMHEAGLGNVMSGVETAPAALTAGASEEDITAHVVSVNTFKEKNGKLYTRIRLATSNCAEGYSSVASQVVQTFAPIETEEFGDGRSAILALEAKFRADGGFCMQELHDKFGTLEVTAANNFDPARVIQELRRICIELDALGDMVVPARKTHAFLKSLPDKHYGSFKTLLLCKRPSGGGVALDFEDVANHATSYHAMQIRGKVSSNDDCTGSHRRALNTVVHGGAHGFRRQGGRGQGRGRRGNDGGIASGNNNSLESNNRYDVFNSNGNSHGGSSAGNARGARGIGRGSQTSGRRGRGWGLDNDQNYQGRCRYCHNSTEHRWHNCQLRLSHEAEDQNANEQVNAVQESTLHA